MGACPTCGRGMVCGFGCGEIEDQGFDELKCAGCGELFYADWIHDAVHADPYCSDDCRARSRRKSAARRKSEPPAPSGCYVYMWFRSARSAEPYYVGKGTGKRAWREGHGVVKILQEGMTESDALLVESALIRCLSMLGVKLENKTHVTHETQAVESI